MLRQILLAYDGTANSDEALGLATELARSLQAKLQVLTVVDQSTYPDSLELEAERRSAWRNLRVLEGMAAREQVSLQLEVLAGSPAEEILKQATRLPADLLVLGRPRPTTIERLASASVADLVLAEAPCAVLLPKASSL